MSIASIFVWGKGFRVSKNHPEFQLLVPPKSDYISSRLAANLDSSESWPDVLSLLSEQSERAIEQQCLLLVAPTELLMMSVERTIDGHGRPSLMAVAGSISVSWSDPHLVNDVCKLEQLTKSLCREYRETFRKSPQRIQEQLAKDLFLRNREFDLAHIEDEGKSIFSGIVDSVRKWKNIRGVASPSLAQLGANVMIATRHEVEKWKGGWVDGYYSVRDHEIIPLGNRLLPWVEAEPEMLKSNIADKECLEGVDRIQLLQNSVNDLDVSIRALTESMNRVTDLLEATLGAAKKRSSPGRDERARGWF